MTKIGVLPPTSESVMYDDTGCGVAGQMDTFTELLPALRSQ